MDRIKKIAFIGAGNVATHLAKASIKNGFKVIEVYSRTEESAKALANKLNCQYNTNHLDITKKADLYIMAISDKAIEKESRKFVVNTKKILVHTSGSVGLDAIIGNSENTGVLYPLQTFTIERALTFKKIPLFIEADKHETMHQLKEFAQKIADQVIELNSIDRMYLHIAAVFFCNYVNFMLCSGQKIIKKNHFSHKYFEPLLDETIRKAIDIGPEKAQTGPASRGDIETINKHLEALCNEPELKDLYASIADAILKHKNYK